MSGMKSSRLCAPMTTAVFGLSSEETTAVVREFVPSILTSPLRSPPPNSRMTCPHMATLRGNRMKSRNQSPNKDQRLAENYRL